MERKRICLELLMKTGTSTEAYKRMATLKTKKTINKL
jgi:hypothetical protein